jgi:hypothetical protein
MAEIGFKNFGDLYRAAFAEPNPERKLLLMSQVKQVLDEWEQASAPRASTIVRESAVVPYK